MPISFGIVTPTLNRRILLRRFLKRVRAQAYDRWRLLVVHDGPNPEIRALVEGFAKTDARIEYTETSACSHDAGVTPRLVGAQHFLNAAMATDYLLFWDDDNSYAVDALQRIANAVEAAGFPDLLIVSVEYGKDTIPPAHSAPQTLDVGQVDTACLVFRPALARNAYLSVQRQMGIAPRDVLSINDHLAYQYVRRLSPQPSIALDRRVLVGRHDGLRWGPFVRSFLHLPALGIARLFGLGR